MFKAATSRGNCSEVLTMKKHLTLTAALLVAAAALGACAKHDDNGAIQKATGHIESAAGDLTGSSKLKHDGKKDEIEGGVKSVVGDVKDTIHDATKSH
jgi:uncharacterized protein YjbJ (UPF0337 family)